MTEFDLGDEADDASTDNPEKQSADATSADTNEDVDSEDSDPRETPAFEFSSDLQESIYIRSESWQKFEDAMEIEIPLELREEGVRNVSKREFHDAMVQYAADNPKAIAKIVLDARGVNSDEN